MRRGLGILVGVLAALASTLGARAQQDKTPEPLSGLDLEPKLGQFVPADVKLTNADGKSVVLGDYLNHGKPVLLSLVYFRCPMMCPLTLTRLQERLNAVPFTLGDDFLSVVVSFDSTENAEAARLARDVYIAGYTRSTSPTARAGWTFHAAEAGESKRLADSIGFKYRFIPESSQFSHGSVIAVLTPDGRVARYLDGLGSDAKELRLALLEATEGKIARTWGDFFLHLCYRYDPHAGAYTVQAMRLMRAGGVLTMLAIGGLIFGTRLRRRITGARAASKAPALALGRTA
ncbi:MAG: SCO family protein [Phycisphaerales bacterium]